MKLLCQLGVDDGVPPSVGEQAPQYDLYRRAGSYQVPGCWMDGRGGVKGVKGTGRHNVRHTTSGGETETGVGRMVHSNPGWRISRRGAGHA